MPRRAVIRTVRRGSAHAAHPCAAPRLPAGRVRRLPTAGSTPHRRGARRAGACGMADAGALATGGAPS